MFNKIKKLFTKKKCPHRYIKIIGVEQGKGNKLKTKTICGDCQKKIELNGFIIKEV